MDIGFIALHRGLLTWEWYSDANTMRLFIHCLLKANWQPKPWNGIVVERGSFVTGREKLSREIGLTVAQVRHSLDKLKATNNIAIKVTSKYSIITVVKYDDYQNTTPAGSQQSNQQSSQEVTTTNNINKLNNTLMSEIKISDDEKFFELKDIQIEASKELIAYFKIAERFRQQFIKNLEEKQAPLTHQIRATFKNYVSPVKHMVEIDKVDIEQLREALRFLQSREGEFWKANILSTKKLREKLDMLIVKKNASKPQPQKQADRL